MSYNDFMSISGWVFAAISALVALYQTFEKKKYKKMTMSQKNTRGSTGYQADTITVNKK